jgi:hypothetical protein
VKKVTIAFHDDATKVIPYLKRMREESFPFLRTDLSSRAISNGLYGHGSKRALAHLEWDWNKRYPACSTSTGGGQQLSQDRRRKLEICIMVRDDDITLLRLMLDGLDFTFYPEPFWQQKEMRKRRDVFAPEWSFPKLDAFL